jgi:hypothetical protein
MPTDAHCYKSVEMLKQFKVITLAPTCFGSRRTIISEQSCAWLKLQLWLFTVLAGMVWRHVGLLNPLLTSALNGRLQSGTIPKAAIIQLYLLKMSMVMLETCRGF